MSYPANGFRESRIHNLPFRPDMPSQSGSRSKERIVMVKLAALCAVLFSCLALAPSPANAATSVQPPYFTVRLLSANGSGCPPGSTAVSQANSTEFTVTYSQYMATAGGGASAGEFRKNCQLNVNVGVPSGWTFGILAVDYRGYAHLGNAARGTLSASYYYAGLP